MTIRIGQRVRVCNHGECDGQTGVVVSSNGGSIIGVELDAGSIAPFYEREVRRLSRQVREDQP